MQTLNSFIDPRSILRDMEIEVKRVPDITTCPACRANEFYVGQDPNGGGWYTCGHCRWVGDSPQLISRVRGITIENALNYLKDQDRVEAITPYRIDEYLAYLKYMRGATDFWMEASNPERILSDIGEQGRHLLDAYRLPDLVGRDTWNDGMGQFAGLGSRKLYNQFVNPTDSASSYNVSLGQFVVSPMFDAPGRISALAAFDTGRGQKTYKIVSIPYGNTDALMFMNSVYMYDDEVFATPDLSFALCLQVWAHESNMKPLPLLGYSASTVAAWANVRPQKLIFWDREVNDDLFVAARNVADRAYIASKPAFEDPKDPYYHLAAGDYTAAKFLGCMRESAVPWLQALKDYLMGRDFGQSITLVRRLDLTPSHRQSMLKVCSNDSERHKIASVVDTGVIDMVIPTPVKNQYIVQKSNGWYLQNKASGELTRVASAIPVIETFTNFQTHTSLAGYIRAEDKNIPFEIDKDDFCPTWMEDYCFKHGEPVMLHSKIYRDLLHYAIEFHRPVEADGLDVIGWDGSGFIFPRFAIRKDGREVEHRRPVARPHPAQELHLPNATAIRYAQSWVQNTPAHAVYWALVGSLITNIIAPAVGEKTRGIGLVNRFDDDRIAILNGLAEDMALATHHAGHGAPSDLVSELVRAEHEHNLPLHVVFTGSPLLMQWMQDPKPRNAVTLISPGVIKSALLRGGWTLIDMREQLKDPISIPHGKAVMPSILLSYVQNDCRLPQSTGCLTDKVFELIRVWLRQSFNLERVTVLDRAKRLVDTGTPDGPAGAGSRFVGTVLYFLDNGAINIHKCMDLVGRPSDRHAVTVHADWVYLDFPIISKAFSRAGLVFPDASELSQSFRDQGVLREEHYGLNSIGGWYLNIDWWNAEVRRWS